VEKPAEKWVWVVRGVAFPYVMGGHELSEILESDLLCQCVLRGCKCWEPLGWVAIFSNQDAGYGDDV
jgi:hypothetical protein